MKLTSTTAAERSMSSGGCGRKGAGLGVQVAISATLCIILLLVTVSTRSVVAEKEMPGPTVGPNPVQATSFRSGIESQWSEILNIAPAVDKIVRSDTYACFAGIKANATKTLWTKLDQQPSSLVALFVHVPKCGGSALTTVLRRFACEANGPSSDCCANPGFCQRAKGAMRTCSSLPGCHGHVPHLRVYAAKPRYANVKAVTMLRDPVSRVISAWHYRCHNPNFDCYDVPGAAKWGLQLRLARGKPIPRGALLPTTNVTFVEYVTRDGRHTTTCRRGCSAATSFPTLRSLSTRQICAWLSTPSKPDFPLSQFSNCSTTLSLCSRLSPASIYTRQTSGT